MNYSAENQFKVILLIVLLGFMGNSIAYPIFAPLFLHKEFGHIVPAFANGQMHSLWLGITLMMYPLGQFFGSPILGGLSDSHGRKKVLLASGALIIVFYLMSALALTFGSLWLLIISRFLTGCCEGNMSIARSMVSDMPELNKHKSMGMINAMSAIGYIIGPLIGGILSNNQLVSWFDFSIPFYFASFLSLGLLLLMSFFLRETLASPVKKQLNLYQEFNILAKLKRLCQNRTLKILLISSTAASLSYDTFYEFYPAYMVGLWQADSTQISIYTAALSLAICIGCGWLSYYFSKFLSHESAIIYSLPVIAIILFALILCPPQSFSFLLFILIGFAISIATTNFTVQVSESVDTTIQGEVLGMQWGLRTLADAFISLIGGGFLIISYLLPIGFAAGAALLSWLIYYHFFTKSKQLEPIAQ